MQDKRGSTAAVTLTQPSAMPWFRTYRSDLYNRSIQELPGDACRFLMNLRCLAEHLSGDLPPAEDIAFACRLTAKKVEKFTKLLLAAGLLVEVGPRLCISDWHQFASDNSGELKRNQRLKSKPSQDCPETIPETEDRTNAEPCPSKVPSQNRREEIHIRGDIRGDLEGESTRAPATMLAEHAKASLTDYQAAAEYGLDAEGCDLEFEGFVNHHLAKGTLNRNWSAAWRSWLRKMNTFAH